MTCHALGAKQKESGLLLGSSNGDIGHSCAGSENESIICTSVKTVHLNIHSNVTVIKAKVELDSH